MQPTFADSTIWFLEGILFGRFVLDSTDTSVFDCMTGIWHTPGNRLRDTETSSEHYLKLCVRDVYWIKRYIDFHRFVWMYYNGVILPGYHVHHIDENRYNNHHLNLATIEGTEHSTSHYYHGQRNPLLEPDVIAKRKAGLATFREQKWAVMQAVVSTGFKPCTRCGETLPLDHFAKITKPGREPRYVSQCKKCKAEVLRINRSGSMNCV